MDFLGPERCRQDQRQRISPQKFPPHTSHPSSRCLVVFFPRGWFLFNFFSKGLLLVKPQPFPPPPPSTYPLPFLSFLLSRHRPKFILQIWIRNVLWWTNILCWMKGNSERKPQFSVVFPQGEGGGGVASGWYCFLFIDNIDRGWGVVFFPPTKRRIFGSNFFPFFEKKMEHWFVLSVIPFRILQNLTNVQYRATPRTLPSKSSLCFKKRLYRLISVQIFLNWLQYRF